MTYPTADSRQLSILLRISRELDVVGDVTATVDQPSDVLAWATVLPEPTIGAWRAEDSGHRYVQVTAPHHRDPIHGRVTAVLPCEAHREFWDERFDRLESYLREVQAKQKKGKRHGRHDR